LTAPLYPLVLATRLLYSSLYLKYLHSFPTRRSSDLYYNDDFYIEALAELERPAGARVHAEKVIPRAGIATNEITVHHRPDVPIRDRKSTRLNSSHQIISYAVFCLKKKKQTIAPTPDR